MSDEPKRPPAVSEGFLTNFWKNSEDLGELPPAGRANRAKLRAREPSEPLAEMRLGIVSEGDEAVIELSIDGVSVVLDADKADELSTDLRGLAIELRNGGRVG